MNGKLIRAGLLWLALAAVFCGLFILSNQPAGRSSEISVHVSEQVVEVTHEKEGLSADVREYKARHLDEFVRKSAHFLIFMFLGMLALPAMMSMGQRRAAAFIWAAGICLFTAVFDEVHQMFVEGRSGLVSDVLIDMSGACIGMLAAAILIWCISTIRRRILSVRR